MNSTLRNFNYPDSLIKDYEHWSLLLRPNQITYGSMVLCIKDDVFSVADMSSSQIEELGRVLSSIDSISRSVLKCDKMNYLMLMMVDPHVHYHIFPRYDVNGRGQISPSLDSDWPRPPDLSRECKINTDDYNDLRIELIKAYE